MQDFFRSKMYKQSIYMTLIAVVDKQKGSTICPLHLLLLLSRNAQYVTQIDAALTTTIK